MSTGGEAPKPSDLDRDMGEQAIHAAMARLDGLEARPVEEHVERFEAVHTALTDALSSIDKI